MEPQNKCGEKAWRFQLTDSESEQTGERTCALAAWLLTRKKGTEWLGSFTAGLGTSDKWFSSANRTVALQCFCLALGQLDHNARNKPVEAPVAKHEMIRCVTTAETWHRSTRIVLLVRARKVRLMGMCQNWTLGSRRPINMYPTSRRT